jgi:acetylornithine deacetylase/succinyl-diaminopimelate desuccinylase family protein
MWKEAAAVTQREQALVAWIEQQREEILRLAINLIRFRTVSSRPDARERYDELNEYLAKEMGAVGLKVQTFRKDATAGANLVGLHAGTGGGKTLLMGGHTDVVPADEPDWISGNGYEAKVIDGKLYGRGSADMKGGLAACLVAIRALKEKGVKLRGDILLVGSVDEEIGGVNGMGYLVESGSVKVDYAINAEQTDLAIMTAYKGNCWIEVKVTGATAHGSTPHLGVNAIEKAAKVIQTIASLGLTYETDPVLGSSTVNIGLIKGGTAKNVVANECTFTLDVRMVPGQTAENVLAEVQALLAKMMKRDPQLKASADFNARNTKPVVIPETEPLVQALLRRGEQVTGKRPEMRGFISAGDMWHFQKVGVPGLMFGPGSLPNIHKSNEFALVEELVNAAKIYALTALDLCA